MKTKLKLGNSNFSATSLNNRNSKTHGKISALLDKKKAMIKEKMALNKKLNFVDTQQSNPLKRSFKIVSNKSSFRKMGERNE